MSEEKSNTINYIFYLQMRSDLDNSFYLLSEVLSKINIALLPITGEELKSLDRAKKFHLIALRNDFSTALHLREVQKNFLETAMSTGKIALYDISSFSAFENANKFQGKGTYRFFQLPLNLKQVAMTVAVEYFKDRNNQVEQWPGGKRAKLPSMENES